MNFSHLPDTAQSYRLLQDIADRGTVAPAKIADKPVMLYGAGNLGSMAREYLDYVGVDIIGVVDASPERYRYSSAWRGIAVYSPSDVPDEIKKRSILAICISTIPYQPVHRELLAHGWTDVVHFYDLTGAYLDRHPLNNGWLAGELSPLDLADISSVLGQWDDDISRAHHLQFLAWRCLREEWTFEGAIPETGNRYFVPEVCDVLTGSESFLDIGAYHGETSISFSRFVNGSFHDILAIEPDEDNASRLKGNFDRHFPGPLVAKVGCVRHVLGEQTGNGHFFSGIGYASQLSDIGHEYVTVRTIDSLGTAPSFMKLHLEGGELAALKGARDTIRKNRPIIAATAYHNRLGLWELHTWFADNLTDYRLLLRLHGWCGTALVIYAIPVERTCFGRNRTA